MSYHSHLASIAVLLVGGGCQAFEQTTDIRLNCPPPAFSPALGSATPPPQAAAAEVLFLSWDATPDPALEGSQIEWDTGDDWVVREPAADPRCNGDQSPQSSAPATLSIDGNASTSFVSFRDDDPSVTWRIHAESIALPAALLQALADEVDPGAAVQRVDLHLHGALDENSGGYAFTIWTDDAAASSSHSVDGDIIVTWQ